MEQKLDLTKFEVLKENAQGSLIGGFSASLSAMTEPLLDDPTNNCNSGNCKTGCGAGQNTVAHCGAS